MEALIYTNHYINDRRRRDDFIRKEIGLGEILDTFEVDKGNKNGPELHSITTTGIVIIRNKKTRLLVTMLIARPAQIKRYYERAGQEIPLDVVRIAKEHERKGYNYK